MLEVGQGYLYGSVVLVLNLCHWPAATGTTVSREFGQYNRVNMKSDSPVSLKACST